MFRLSLDMYQTLAVAVGVLFLGGYLKKKVKILKKPCENIGKIREFYA